MESCYCQNFILQIYIFWLIARFGYVLKDQLQKILKIPIRIIILGY